MPAIENVVPRESVMLEQYLREIERLVRIGEHSKALDQALALPQIAVSLATLSAGSEDALKEWCNTWTAEEPNDIRAQCLALLSNDDRPSENRQPVLSSNVLLRLRLFRHLRREPFAPGLASEQHADEPSVPLVAALVRATRAWYRAEGRTERVQQNLASLALFH